MRGDDRWAGGDGGRGTPFEDVEDVAGLGPLPDGLQPEVRDFVRALRGLFKATGKSLRQFAAYHHVSPPSVSRYLSGKRLPDKNFIDALLKSACKAHGVDISPDVQAYAYRLHREALLAQQPGRYRLQMASDKLEEAILAREQAELQIRDLTLSVSDQKRELNRLERQQREIARSAAEERGRTAAQIEVYRGRQRDLEAQCHELRGEIDRLEAELKQAERDRDDARARCAELERKLASTEEDAEREELEERVAEVRREMADASQTAQGRLVELQRAAREAERLRDQATREAQAKREEADAVYEAARAKAAQAAADFETNLAKRREQSERDLTARQTKAEKHLAEIEGRAEQLRLEAQTLLKDAERRAREMVEAARQDGVLPGRGDRPIKQLYVPPRTT
ncbi:MULTISPECIES: helix-turn-helix transcriptional regulator [Streptomyces]|uniref:helix-turn-helix domain-containing protein n=1 Tax=unclassified Streptomyces TaxID=2593676 RepID=UPI001489E97F|nr:MULTISPECIES: helix-turn-helix transcriptional regulator [Streptomyces]